MALCGNCGQEMTTADGCVATRIVIEGESYQPIRYGSEPGLKSIRRRCHDCNMLLGRVHHPGCDMERCPACEGQSISCGCLWAGEEHLAEDWAEEMDTEQIWPDSNCAHWRPPIGDGPLPTAGANHMRKPSSPILPASSDRAEKVQRLVYAAGILLPVLAFGLGRALAAPIKDGAGVRSLWRGRWLAPSCLPMRAPPGRPTIETSLTTSPGAPTTTSVPSAPPGVTSMPTPGPWPR